MTLPSSPHPDPTPPSSLPQEPPTTASPGEADASKAEERWTVYVLGSLRRGRTYVGITVDVQRRLAQHNGEQAGGARATRAGRPWTLLACYGPYRSRGDALRAELRIKRLRGAARLCADEPLAHPPNAVSNAPAG